MALQLSAMRRRPAPAPVGPIWARGYQVLWRLPRLSGFWSVAACRSYRQPPAAGSAGAAMSERFAIVLDAITEDSRIPHATFRFFVLLLSYARKKGWCFGHPTGLGQQLSMHRTTVLGHLRILKSLGYLEMFSKGRPDGKPGSYYRLNVGNSDTGLLETPTQIVGNSDNKLLEIPTTSVGNSNSPQIPHIEQEKQGKRDKGIETVNRALTTRLDANSGLNDSKLDSEFEWFWELYPNKRGMKRARAAFAEARKIVSFETLIGAVAAYKRDCDDHDRIIANAANWLVDERFDDEFEGSPIFLSDAARAIDRQLNLGTADIQIWPAIAEREHVDEIGEDGEPIVDITDGRQLSLLPEDDDPEAIDEPDDANVVPLARRA
jgi:hypothetical protein